jgi:hypothetical protein
MLHCIVLVSLLRRELLMAFLNNQHAGDIPSKYEMGTRALICLSSYCVQIQPGCSVCHARFPDEGDDVRRPDLCRYGDAL